MFLDKKTAAAPPPPPPPTPHRHHHQHLHHHTTMQTRNGQLAHHGDLHACGSMGRKAGGFGQVTGMRDVLWTKTC